ncbi:MAG: hypothetical protein F4X87_05715 [Chloroflexi bacterium]|nr:hypothetical protein [Chloroflexota bacterium]
MSSSSSPSSVVKELPITFVTFYLDVTDQTMATIHETTSTITVTEPHRYIHTMFASAARFHPDCRLVILSDQHTRFPPHPAAEIIRYELDPMNPMMSRSIAWLNYLRRADGHTIFLDSDILINGDLSHIFADDFAVCFTYRDGDAKWPINAGINFVHGRHLANAADFHARWLGRYRAAHHDYSVWGGDQDTLRELFAAVDFAREEPFTQPFGDFDIRFIPCAIYNFSTKIAEDMDGYYPDARVLHFKGRRKPFMLPYWRTHILGEKEAIRRAARK